MHGKYTIKTLMFEYKLKQNLKNEIEKLSYVKEIIGRFFDMLLKEKDKIFLNFNDKNFIDALNIIISFVKENSKGLGEFQKRSQGIDVFINLIHYCSKKPYIGSLSNFEEYILENIDRLKTDDKNDLYAFLGKDIFWKKVQQDVNAFIDTLIYGLEKLKKGKIIEFVEQNVSRELFKSIDVEIGSYVKSLEIILRYLYLDQKEKIATVLYENGFLKVNENLYHFFTENESYFKKIDEGKKLYEFVIKLNENSFNKSFEELKQELIQFKIGELDIVQFPKKLENILKGYKDSVLKNIKK